MIIDNHTANLDESIATAIRNATTDFNETTIKKDKSGEQQVIIDISVLLCSLEATNQITKEKIIEVVSNIEVGRFKDALKKMVGEEIAVKMLNEANKAETEESRKQLIESAIDFLQSIALTENEIADFFYRVRNMAIK